MKKIMFVVNDGNFFVSHRLAIAKKLLKQKYQVHLVVGENAGNKELNKIPLIIHPVKLKRNSLDPLSNLGLFLQFIILFLRVRPDLVHLITIKPVLLGGIASLFFPKMSVVAAITGLGYLYISVTLKSKLIRYITGFCYKLALSKERLIVIFQNRDDQNVINSITSLPTSKIRMIKGSGVDLKKYYFSPLPQGAPIVMLASRLLIDKGIREFVETARILKQHYTKTRFVLVGAPDYGNLASISKKQLEAWMLDGLIEWWGFRKDMPKVLSASYIVILPSYGEGFPKILMEASACGRPIITTDVPGCRDSIIPNETGILIPPKDALTLAKELCSLLANRSKCEEMGYMGRVLAENVYDLRNVVDKHIKIYQNLLNYKN